MKADANSVAGYIKEVPDDRRSSFIQLCTTITENLPQGFEIGMSYGMISWSVPLETYPAGYHCKANTPLPFISVALQKNFVAVYHMGMYADLELLNWFVEEFPKYSSQKLDMGKSCIRFKKPEEIPFDFIAKLCQKMTPENWISLYEKDLKK